MGLISLDFIDTMLQVKKLENAANQCEDADAAVRAAYSDVCDSWEGEAAEAFKQKLKEWEKENANIERKINTIAKNIKRVAERIKEADEKAASFE